jgi:hypothetical protein
VSWWRAEVDENKSGEPETHWRFLEPDRASIDRITRAALAGRRSRGAGIPWARPVLALLVVVVMVAGLAAAREGWRQAAWSLQAPAIRHSEVPSAVAAPVVADFDAFMRLPPEDRRRSFDKFDARQKADIARRHATEWLRTNRSRLDSFEASGVQALIDFISPRLYENPHDQSAAASESEFSRSLMCVVRPDVVREALDMFDRHAMPPPSAAWSYFDRAKCWVGRVVDSTIDCAELRVCRL